MDGSLPGSIAFGREICGNFRQAESREWWLANGIGGYAAGTVAGSLSRRYHGLLIAPLHPPLGRTLVVAKADATLVDGEREWPLFTNRWWNGVVDPEGYLRIENFHLDGRVPVWRYAVDGLRLAVRIWMEPGENTTYVAYRLETSPWGHQKGMGLRVRLLVNGRDHHGETKPRAFIPFVEMKDHGLRVVSPDRFHLRITPRGGVIDKKDFWVNDFDLPVERERGLSDRDSHLCVGEASIDLVPGRWSGIVFTLHPEGAHQLDEAMERVRAHDRSVIKTAETRVPEMAGAPDWIKQLVLAADSFLFSRPLPGLPDGESVIAGYPWFGDWGRDTMISLPGLTLATGRYDTAKRILLTFARYVDQGMLPNLFPEGGEPLRYNTVDASLWYIEAWRAYVQVTRDLEALRPVFPVLEEILKAYREGTRYRIHMDPEDHLLYAGEPGVQLTWMDAKVGDWVVTPRIGKPVEINALWFNAHRGLADFAERLGRSGKHYEKLAIRIRQGFTRFINQDTGGLSDVIDGPAGDDHSIRPNQIIAVSLAHSPLERDSQKSVVSLCGRHLFSSFGLRSLSPIHPDYRACYRGNVWERDGSYHQGPVWAWLLGHYALAEFRVHGNAAAAQSLLDPIRHHLFDAGLGTVSEIFDGDPPHIARGCPSQAWSVACILDAWWKLERAKNETPGNQ